MNANAFYYDFKNFDVQAESKEVLDITTGNYITYSASGIGDAVIYGIDVSTNYIFSQNDRVELQVSYLSAEVDTVTISYIDDTTGDTLPDEIIPGGQRLNNSPEFSITASYDRRFLLSGTGGNITWHIDTRFQTESTLAFTPITRRLPDDLVPYVDEVNTSPNFHMSNTSLTYNAPGGNWSLSGYVKNIENHAQKVGFVNGRLRIGAPRTCGAVLTVNL